MALHLWLMAVCDPQYLLAYYSKYTSNRPDSRLLTLNVSNVYCYMSYSFNTNYASYDVLMLYILRHIWLECI